MLGASTLCFYNEDPQKAAESLAREFPLIEVIVQGNIPLSKTHRMPEVILSLHAPFSDINIASLNSTMRNASIEELEKAVGLAEFFGAGVMTLHPGNLTFHTQKNSEVARKIQISSLGRLASFAEERNIILALENMPRQGLHLGKSPEEMEEIMKMVDSSHLRMTLDIGHASTNGNLSEFMRLKGYIVNMHIHDNRGKDEHLSLGEGIIHFDEFFGQLGKYDGNIVIELAEKRGLRKSKQVVESILGLETKPL
jgi:sugar phosphate isomerase/epimerase